MLSGEWLEPSQARSMRSPPISRLRFSWKVSSGAGRAGSLSRRRRRRVSSWPMRTMSLSSKKGRRPGVVGVVVPVDEVGHLVANAVGRGDLVDGPPDVVADGGRGVEQHDPVGCGQERRLVGAVGHRVEVPVDTVHVVALLVQGRAERRLRDRRVVWQVCSVARARIGERLGARVGSAHQALRPFRSACHDRPDPGDPPSPDAGDSPPGQMSPIRASMTGVATGLLRRDELLAALDRSSERKVTVISAPPGSGKTSLLRAWSDRTSEDRRVAFVSVPRDQEDAQQFWLAVLDAIRRTDAVADSRRQPAAPDFDGDVIVDTVISELAEAAGVVVLVIDDLHELSSADALSQLEHLLGALPESAHVVLSSRRDPPIKLHQLRLAGEVAELRASDLRFSRERDPRTAGRLGDQSVRRRGGRAVRTHGGLGGRPAPGGDLPQRSPRPGALRGRVLRDRPGDRGIPDGGDARTPSDRGAEHAVADLVGRPVERRTGRPAGRPPGL